MCAGVVAAAAVAALVARVVYSVDTAAPTPAAATPRPAAPPADDRVAVSPARAVASRPGGRVFYAEGMAAEAEQFDRLLWRTGFFAGEVPETEIWLDAAAGRTVVAERFDGAGPLPAGWRDARRAKGCELEAQFHLGRPLDWVTADADWRVRDRVSVQPAHEVVVSAAERLLVEVDPEAGERAARRLTAAGFFTGRGRAVVSLLREPGRWVLCLSLDAPAVSADLAATLPGLRDALQQDAAAGDVFVVRCLPAGAGAPRDFGPAVSPGPP